jgi:hypothetical protein
MMMKESTGMMTDDELSDRYDGDGMSGVREKKDWQKLRNNMFLENEGIVPSKLNAQWENDRFIDELAERKLLLSSDESDESEESLRKLLLSSDESVESLRKLLLSSDESVESLKKLKGNIGGDPNRNPIDKLGEMSSKAYDYTPLGALTNLTGLTTSESDKIKPYDNPINNQNNALKQNELNNEKSKYEDKNEKKPKDSIINAPTNNVNNSKQNITNVIDTSKNSFNSAINGLRGAF